MATTNGTAAILAVQGARDVIIASYVNFSAVLSMLRAALRGGTDVAIVCAGQEKHFSLEDSACAGLFVQHITEKHTVRALQKNQAVQMGASETLSGSAAQLTFTNGFLARSEL